MPQICLRSVGGLFGGRSWESGQVLRIGRLEGLEVPLDHPSVSRHHAEVSFTEHGWAVRDLGSTNGTYLNGLRVGRGERQLREGDILQVGSVMLKVTGIKGRTLHTPDTTGHVKAAVRLSWEDVPQLLRSDKLRPKARDPLLSFVQLGRDFFHHHSVNSLLESILWEAAEALDARSGAVVVRDEATGGHAVRAVFRFGKQAAREDWLRSGLPQLVLAWGESLLCHGGPNGAAAGDGKAGAAGAGSTLGALLRSPRKPLGVLLLARAADQEPFETDDLRLADALALCVSAGIDSLERLLRERQDLFLQVLTSLGQIVAAREDASGNRTQRVTDYALLVAEALKLSELERHYLRVGTPLVNLGKIAISDAILQKSGPLSAEEISYLRSHVLKGVELVEGIPGMAELLPIIRNHHERWDGTGYPDGLAGEQIPLLARIVAVADSFDAMTQDRPYRRQLSAEEAFGELQAKAGTQFDPRCVRAMLQVRPQIEGLLSQRNGATMPLHREEGTQAWRALGLLRTPEQKTSGNTDTWCPAGGRSRN